jgi:hypothetical protein
MAVAISVKAALILEYLSIGLLRSPGYVLDRRSVPGIVGVEYLQQIRVEAELNDPHAGRL